MVPVGLFAAFRLIAQEPEPEPEVVTADTVYWNMTRPAGHVTIDEWVRNLYTDDVASIGLDLHILGYKENWFTFSGRYDTVEFKIIATANLSVGYVKSVFVRFCGIDAEAHLDIVADLNDPHWVELHNLTIRSVRDSGRTNEPYIDAVAINQPKQCSLSMYAYWQFREFSEEKASHWITPTLEVTYFNGTAHRKATIPTCLGVLAD